MKYVVGFILSNDKQNILLIRKNRPEWQKGFLNGIGGKIEKDEIPLEAIIRECYEECGLDIQQWYPFSKTVFYADNTELNFFYSLSADISLAKTKTDEEIVIFPIRAIPIKETLPDIVGILSLILSYLNT